ncbi:MAG: hypothetical protein B7Y55_00035 [Polynucleobacter sp. 35-46-207]|jgi:outer membrane protein TolC|nr:MAG: hypothetical protein B7Y55_00035 [Polynucleobacter sp. 35-46-207]OZB49537.1 MAG: hypothetical protein B7X60_00830 [Polynucleobacter sp. 39-45-136]
MLYGVRIPILMVFIFLSILQFSWVGGAFAQAGIDSKKRDLKNVYELAWDRQPEAKSFQYRVEAAQAKQKIASSLLANPAYLELAQKTDRTNSNQGVSETIAGLGFPLWLWGERSSSIGLADAEYKKLLSQYYVIQLKIAAEVRDIFWGFQKAQVELVLANTRYENAATLAKDVSKRFVAGDLSRADVHQAEGAMSFAEAILAEAKANAIGATQKMSSLTGSKGQQVDARKANSFSLKPEPIPKVPQSFSDLDASQPVVVALLDQLEVAKKALELAKAQTRSTPELQLLTTRGREVYGVPYQQSITLGIKFPFGSDARNTSRVATSTADKVEAESLLNFERERILFSIDSAVGQVEASKVKLDAANKRSKLASETRGFFEKSFRFGETDLPTRLRIELEAVEANRQAALAQIDHSVAISNLRQALGLLPE